MRDNEPNPFGEEEPMKLWELLFMCVIAFIIVFGCAGLYNQVVDEFDTIYQEGF